MTRDSNERGQLNAFRQFGAPIMELVIQRSRFRQPIIWEGIRRPDHRYHLLFAIATLCYLLCFLWSKRDSAGGAGRFRGSGSGGKSVSGGAEE